jgi:hypothetical protein
MAGSRARDGLRAVHRQSVFDLCERSRSARASTDTNQCCPRDLRRARDLKSHSLSLCRSPLHYRYPCLLRLYLCRRLCRFRRHCPFRCPRCCLCRRRRCCRSCRRHRLLCHRSRIDPGGTGHPHRTARRSDRNSLRRCRPSRSPRRTACGHLYIPAQRILQLRAAEMERADLEWQRRHCRPHLRFHAQHPLRSGPHRYCSNRHLQHPLRRSTHHGSAHLR